MLQEDLFPYSKKDWLNKQQSSRTGSTNWKDSLKHDPQSPLTSKLFTNNYFLTKPYSVYNNFIPNSQRA